MKAVRSQHSRRDGISPPLVRAGEVIFVDEFPVVLHQDRVGVGEHPSDDVRSQLVERAHVEASFRGVTTLPVRRLNRLSGGIRLGTAEEK